MGSTEKRQLTFFEFPEIEKIEKKLTRRYLQCKKKKIKRPSKKAIKEEIVESVKAVHSRTAIQRKRIRQKNRRQRDNLKKLMGLSSRLRAGSRKS